MFNVKNVPIYFERMGHKQVKIGAETYTGTQIVLRVDPLTPALAAELGGAKSRLFKSTDGEPHTDMDAVSLTFRPRPQMIELRSDPAIGRPVLTIPEAKCTAFKVRKPSDGSQWVLRFVITFVELGAEDLLYLKDALFEQRFLTFENAQNGLFDDADKEAARSSKDAAPVRPRRSRGGDDATTEGHTPATH